MSRILSVLMSYTKLKHIHITVGNDSLTQRSYQHYTYVYLLAWRVFFPRARTLVTLVYLE